MAADPLNEHLVLSEEPPAESSPAAVPRQVRHREVQPFEQYHPPPPAAAPREGREGTQASHERDAADGSQPYPKTSVAQITVNPAAAKTHWQGHRGGGGGLDARLRTPAAPGLRFNVLQQHHGKHITAELVPVTEDERAPPPAAAEHSNGGAGGVNNNSSGRQVGYGGGGGGGPHRGGGVGLPHSAGRKQGADSVAGPKAANKSVDIGECGGKMIHSVMYANENVEMILACLIMS